MKPNDRQEPPLPGHDDQALQLAAEHLIQLKNNVGWTLLMVQLKRDEIDALERLATIEPGDSNGIEAAQRRVERYRWFKETIDILINQGLDPEILDDLEQGHDDDYLEEDRIYGEFQQD